MIIRKAELKDIDELIVLSDEFFKEGLHCFGMTMEDCAIRKALRHYIENFIILVAEDNDNIVGFIGGQVTPSMFNNSQIIAQEMAWFVKEEARKGMVGIRLIACFEKECKKKGAQFIIVAHIGNLNVKVLDSLYKKRGYALLERHYIKEI